MCLSFHSPLVNLLFGKDRNGRFLAWNKRLLSSLGKCFSQKKLLYAKRLGATIVNPLDWAFCYWSQDDKERNLFSARLGEARQIKERMERLWTKQKLHGVCRTCIALHSSSPEGAVTYSIPQVCLRLGGIQWSTWPTFTHMTH